MYAAKQSKECCHLFSITGKYVYHLGNASVRCIFGHSVTASRSKFSGVSVHRILLYKCVQDGSVCQQFGTSIIEIEIRKLTDRGILQLFRTKW